MKDENFPLPYTETQLLFAVLGWRPNVAGQEISKWIEKVRGHRRRALIAAALVRIGLAGEREVDIFCDALFAEADPALSAALPAVIEYLTQNHLTELARLEPYFPLAFPAIAEYCLRFSTERSAQVLDRIMAMPADWVNNAEFFPLDFLMKAIPAIRTLPETTQFETLVRVAERRPVLKKLYLEEAWEVATSARQDWKRADYLLVLAPLIPTRVLAALGRLAGSSKALVLCKIIKHLHRNRPAQTEAFLLLWNSLKAASAEHVALILREITPELRLL
jgi:hypothetical protein